MNKYLKKIIIILFATFMVVFVNHREKDIPYDTTPPLLYDEKVEKNSSYVIVYISFKDESANQAKSITVEYNEQTKEMTNVTPQFVNTYSKYSVSIPLEEISSAITVIAYDINNNMSSYTFDIEKIR